MLMVSSQGYDPEWGGLVVGTPSLMQRRNSPAAQWCEEPALPVDLLRVLPSVPLVRRAKRLLVLLLCPLLVGCPHVRTRRGTLPSPGFLHVLPHDLDGIARAVVGCDGIAAMAEDGHGDYFWTARVPQAVLHPVP